jgi:hypothetical protein
VSAEAALHWIREHCTVLLALADRTDMPIEKLRDRVRMETKAIAHLLVKLEAPLKCPLLENCPVMIATVAEHEAGERELGDGFGAQLRKLLDEKKRGD